MALSNNALCTLAYFKSYAEENSDKKDTLLELYIEAASQKIRDYINYDPISASHVERYDGTGNQKLYLNTRPITVLTYVEVWSGDTGDSVLINEYPIIYEDMNYLFGNGYVFPKGTLNIKVSYTAGYTQNDLPAIFIITCLRIAGLMEKEGGEKGSLGISSVSYDAGSRGYIEIGYQKYLDELSEYVRMSG